MLVTFTLKLKLKSFNYQSKKVLFSGGQRFLQAQTDPFLLDINGMTLAIQYAPYLDDRKT